MSNLLQVVCTLKDSIRDAARLDAESPLPEVNGAHPDAGAFCPSRIDSAADGSLERIEAMVRAEIAVAKGDIATGALEGVADAYRDFLNDAKQACFDGREVDQDTVFRLDDAIIRARRFTGDGKQDAKPKHPLMTEPLTKTELADYFVCNRNDVAESVLSKYEHEIVGTVAKPKYRLQVANMPPAYHQKHRTK